MSGGRVLGYLDCSTGVSGDKFLGALLDAGSEGGLFTAADLQAILNHLAPEALVSVTRVDSHGLSALSVSVDSAEQPAHRTWADIRALIGESALPQPVRDAALRAFEALAHAEAQAHGQHVDEIHFHEVGALDSILDVVGVCAGMHALGVGELIASPVATGWGTVATSHGVLPVPAPATATLLVETPVVPGPAGTEGAAPGELTTPTGAALLKTLATGFGPCPALTPRRIGYGAGTRDIGNPNVCRLTVGERASEPTRLNRQTVSVLETNVDHLSPEALSAAAVQLLAEGVADVWTSPIVMKKGRSAVTLSVLVVQRDDPGLSAEHFAQRMVALTGTLGVRRTDLERYEATREVVRADTPYGPAGFKIGPAEASPRFRPEADDVARIARETQRSFADTQRDLADWARIHLDKRRQR